MYYKMVYHSPLGPMSVVVNDEGLRGVWFEGQSDFEKGVSGKVVLGAHPIGLEAICKLTSYFLGETVDFSSLPLCFKGTPFQERVWQSLKLLSVGETTSYGQVASHLNLASAQAVGGAIGKNPYMIIVPCHRVLGKDGNLTGYAGGLDKKRWLLQHESTMMEEKKC